jgi:hypothetical protein
MMKFVLRRHNFSKRWNDTMSNKIVHSKVESKQILASISSLEQRVIALREQVSPENTLVTPLQRAKDCYRKRRLRGMMFESAYLFADPAWDILIDLFIASEEDQRISVSSACIGSAVPTTTALRYIKTPAMPDEFLCR